MLQQTGVAVVIPYWERWMARFPTVHDLARADEDDVLSSWQGLGYYSRARSLRAGAAKVAAEGVPTRVEGWRAVPGIGPYTAGAIASIAQGLPTPLVDGNVERVYARVTADPAVGPRLTKNAWMWAENELDRERPGDHNQALMELGATVCTYRAPKCDECPWRSRCRAFALGDPTAFPTPKPKPVTRDREEWIEVRIADGRVHLEKRAEGEWWAGMWGLPRLASPPAEWSREAGSFRYAVTVHRIQAHVVVTEGIGEGFALDELDGLAIPAPDRRALKIARPFLV